MTKPALINAGPSERGSHRIGTAAECLRKYAFEYEHDGRSTRDGNIYLVRGALLHLALAHWYARRAIETAGSVKVDGVEYTDPEAIMEPEHAVWVQAEAEGAEASGIPETVLQALALYTKEYSGDFMRWRILDIERQYKLRVRPKTTPGHPRGLAFLYTQRADLVAEDRATGEVFVWDHKTAYTLSAKTLRQYILDTQFLGYHFIGGKAWRSKFGGVILNRIDVNRGQFDRRTMEPAPGALAGFLDHLRHWEIEIDAHVGKPPLAWPGAYRETVCFGKYGECPWFSRCQWESQSGP